jgi:hypothetical protein
MLCYDEINDLFLVNKIKCKLMLKENASFYWLTISCLEITYWLKLLSTWLRKIFVILYCLQVVINRHKRKVNKAIVSKTNQRFIIQLDFTVLWSFLDNVHINLNGLEETPWTFSKLKFHFFDNCNKIVLLNS